MRRVEREKGVVGEKLLRAREQKWRQSNRLLLSHTISSSLTCERAGGIERDDCKGVCKGNRKGRRKERMA